jgi:hypothetical protein
MGNLLWPQSTFRPTLEFSAQGQADSTPLFFLSNAKNDESKASNLGCFFVKKVTCKDCRGERIRSAILRNFISIPFWRTLSFVISILSPSIDILSPFHPTHISPRCRQVAYINRHWWQQLICEPLIGFLACRGSRSELATPTSYTQSMFQVSQWSSIREHQTASLPTLQISSGLSKLQTSNRYRVS